jgi:Leucine-rich repeat (LRR) protein
LRAVNCDLQTVTFKNVISINSRKTSLLLLVFLLRYARLVNSQQVECENFQTRTEGDELVEVCRIDQSTSINSFNVTFASEFNENVVEIYAKNNDRIRYLPKNIYETFPNLKTLNFEDCSLRAVTNENLQKLTYLKRIDFSFNKIRTINVGTFDDLINLEQLILSFNKISRMNGDVFKLLVKLRLLDFDGNFCIAENFIGDELNVISIAESVSQKCLVLENYKICQEELKASEQIKETCECSAAETTTPQGSGKEIEGKNVEIIEKMTKT